MAKSLADLTNADQSTEQTAHAVMFQRKHEQVPGLLAWYYQLGDISCEDHNLTLTTQSHVVMLTFDKIEQLRDALMHLRDHKPVTFIESDPFHEDAKPSKWGIIGMTVCSLEEQ